MRNLRYYLVCIWMLFAANATATSTAAFSSTPLPWLVQSKSFCYVIFHLHPEDVKKYLPKGIEPQLNDSGRVNAFLELYESEQIAGMPSYKTAFIAVDIAKYPSRTGLAGHFSIWGKVDSSDAAQFFSGVLGFPYQHASISITASKNKVSGAIGNATGNIMRIQLEGGAEETSSQQGSVNMLSMQPGKGLVKSEVLYLSKGRSGKIRELNITSTNDPVLALFKDTKPQYVWIAEDQIFTYSHFILADH